MLVFDIETGPRPDSEMRRLVAPFDPASVSIPQGDFDESTIKREVSGPFDSSTVKLGMLKDQQKIDAKIEAARLEHEAAAARDAQRLVEAREAFAQRQADAPRILAEAEEAHFASCTAKAALSAVLGRVLAIGVLNPATQSYSISQAEDDASEAIILAAFWRKYQYCRMANNLMVGFNICGFDLPFMARRSWLLGVEVPATLIANDRYYDKVFIDLLAKWKCGNYSESIKLDALAKFFGVGGKPDGITGADFARLFFEDRPTALDYLLNDLRMTAGVAARMGYV